MTVSRLLVINAAEGLLQVLFASCPPDCGEDRARRERAGRERAGRGRAVLEGPGAEQAPLWKLDRFEETPAASQGAEILAPRIKAGLEALGLRPEDLTHVAAVRGPGSFTGLRLALATTAGLARAVGALRAGLDYLPLLAAGALPRLALPGSKAPVLWVLTHARRALVHAQAFACDRPWGGSSSDPAPGFLPGAASGAAPVPALGPALVLSPEGVLTLIAAQAGEGRQSVVLGSGLTRNREAFERGAASLAAGGPAAPFLLGPEYDRPEPQALLAAASTAAFGASDPEPLYVRPSDAEENLEAIAASLKLDPAAARRRLERLTGTFSG